MRGSKQVGVGKNSYATVVATDPKSNLLTVERADGQHVCYDPKRLRGVNVYTDIPREFSTGDRIQFTQNNKDLDVHNRDLGRIEAIGKDNLLTVKMDDGRIVNLDPAQMRHFDHGYAVGASSEITNAPAASSLPVVDTNTPASINAPTMDTNAPAELLNPRFAYVSISRASEDAHIYTNDAATLRERLSTDVTKTSAVDCQQRSANSQTQTSKEHTMQQNNELKPERSQHETPHLTVEQIEHKRRYASIETALGRDANGYEWKRESAGIQSYQHNKTGGWLHIDSQGQFFDRHAQTVTRETALEHARDSAVHSVGQNAQSVAGSGPNSNGFGISL